MTAGHRVGSHNHGIIANIKIFNLNYYQIIKLSRYILELDFYKSFCLSYYIFELFASVWVIGVLSYCKSVSNIELKDYYFIYNQFCIINYFLVIVLLLLSNYYLNIKCQQIILVKSISINAHLYLIKVFYWL